MKSRDDRTNGPKPLATSATRRIESIIEGAEQAAERVIDDAEAKARAYLAEAEAEADRMVAERLASLGELTDALVAQADAIRRQSELLTRSLQDAKQRLDGEAGAEPARVARVVPDEPDEVLQPPRLAAVEPAVEEAPTAQPAEPVEDHAAERPGHGTPAGARLLATQMAVSGSSREEIAARLRNGFESEDAEAILDAILGPEG